MPRLDAVAIARLRALHAASTKGEWEQDAQHIWADHVIIAEYYLAKDPPPFTNVRDAAFTAVAHNALPDLLDDLAEARAENLKLEHRAFSEALERASLAMKIEELRELIGRLTAVLAAYAVVDALALLTDARAWSQPAEGGQ